MAEQTSLRNDLLNTVETEWGRYLSTIVSMTTDDQDHYVHDQGYNSLKDLLAHICAWWQTALNVIETTRNGGAFQQNWKDDDEYNARVIQRYQNETLEQVEEDFDNSLEQIGGVIAELSDEEMQNPTIQRWLLDTVIVHYQKHEPPGDPQIPAEQHTQTTRPETTQ
jgi:hypothetical protein